MNQIWKTSLLNQFLATIDMLENALRSCPDELWGATLWEEESAPPGTTAFWNLAYHSLFYLDLYLSGDVHGFAPPSPFTLDELEEGIVTRVFTRDELLGYVDHNRKKCVDVINRLTDARVEEACKFSWGELRFGELLMDNMRHVQEHAAQLNMFLGQQRNVKSRWVSKMKK